MSVSYHISDTKKSGLPLIIAFALISFLTTSCVTGQSRIIKKTFKKGKQTIRIVEKDKDDPYLSKKKLGHPQSFSESEILNNLKSLKYKRLALFSKKENVFDDELASEISPLLTRAFKKASKKDFIEFDVRSIRGRTLGNVFIFRNKFNWRFKILNGAFYEKNNSRDYLDGWKLVLQKGQKYHGEKEMFGVRVAKDWIIYPVGKTMPDAGLSVKSNPKSEVNIISNSKPGSISEETLPNELSIKDTSTTQKEIEVKFHRLKSLMEKRLITKKEYRARKKELLEEYF